MLWSWSRVAQANHFQVGILHLGQNTTSRHAPSLAHVAEARSTRQNYTPLTPPNPENLRAILASSGISDFPKADIMNYLRRDSAEMARNGPHLLEDPVWGCVHITDDIPIAISDDRTTDNPKSALVVR